MRAALCLGLAAAATGCLRGTEFKCVLDADCGAGGTCEPVGFCSVPNSSCPGSGRSFSDTAGQDLASTCVSSGNPAPGPDAGIDAPIDGAGCPPDYASVGGSAHVYKRLASVSWDEARSGCKTSPRAYLAIPDDAGELANLATAATAPPFWIGLDDKTTEGSFVTQKGVAATFLPWLAGEPDDGPPAEDCVNAVSSTEIATDRCGTRHTAVCECEP